MTMARGDRRYVVAGSKPWNRTVFDDRLVRLPGEWLYVSSRDELSAALQGDVARYVFFLHWSWIVPDDVLARSECVCFHITDVPYGRGGSPLQNLIVRGHERTKLTALRMTSEVDAGPVYAKVDLDLHGTAEEVYMRATAASADLVAWIAEEEPEPAEQTGDIVPFVRRRPAESEIAALASLDALHDFIRMLDADGYPRAFLEHAGFRFEFERAARYQGRIEADVRITRVER